MGAYSRIKPRRGNLYEWETVNPILGEGELVIEYPGNKPGLGLCKFKIGDGVTKYSELAYAFDGASAASINGGNVENSHLIAIRSDNTTNWSAANTILKTAEIAFDTVTKDLKVGDNVTGWNKLIGIQAGTALGAGAGCNFDFGEIENETDNS